MGQPTGPVDSATAQAVVQDPLLDAVVYQGLGGHDDAPTGRPGSSDSTATEDPTGQWDYSAEHWNLGDQSDRDKARQAFKDHGIAVVVDDTGILFVGLGILANAQGRITDYVGPDRSILTRPDLTVLLGDPGIGGGDVPSDAAPTYGPGQEWLRDHGLPYEFTAGGATIEGNATLDPRGQFVRLINDGDGATTFGTGAPIVLGAPSSPAVIATGRIDQDARLLRHELGHVEQARALGGLYLATYVRQQIQVRAALDVLGLGNAANDAHNVHAVHPMEIDADRRAAVPLDYHVGP